MNREEILDQISRFLKSDPGNRIPELDGLRIFEEPLIAFADGSDPIYEELKHQSVIGPHHRSPGEWMVGAKSVISYFLPFTVEIVESNEPEGLPSDEWYLSLCWGEKFNNSLMAHLVGFIEEAGYKGVAPAIAEGYESYRTTSNWSERHTAFIAGLGTFCLSYSLVSERGCAGQYGSVITDIDLPISPRVAKGLRDNCLSERDGGCDVCIRRCPAGAITREGKDHEKCKLFLVEKVENVYGGKYGYFTGACGKCQTNTPCSTTNPRRGG